MKRLYDMRFPIALGMGVTMLGLASSAFAVDDAAVMAISTGIGTVTTSWASVAPVAIGAGLAIFAALYVLRKGKKALG